MNDNNDEMTMDEAMKNIDVSMKKIHTGEIVKGKIISVNDDEIMVNIGYVTDGVIPRAEIDEKIENLKDVFKENDEIYSCVMKINDGEGNVLLSKKKADEVKVWDDLDQDFKNGKIHEVEVNEAVKGGVLTQLEGIRAFIPASQLSVKYVENINDFIGRKLKVRIIDLNKEKQQIVLSSKVVEQEEKEIEKKKVWDSLEKGQKRSGKVTKLMKFGAFVDLGGAEGLIHISQMSWKRVNDPSEVVSVGDNVEVYVLDFDKANNRISLALKEINKNPWDEIDEKYNVNDIVNGKVVKLMNFGAFVELNDGIEGLVHISEICEDKIANPSEKLKAGENVKVKILDINKQNQRISLSIKAAADKVVEDYSEFNDTNDIGTSLGDLLKGKLNNLK